MHHQWQWQWQSKQLQIKFSSSVLIRYLFSFLLKDILGNHVSEKDRGGSPELGRLKTTYAIDEPPSINWKSFQRDSLTRFSNSVFFIKHLLLGHWFTSYSIKFSNSTANLPRYSPFISPKTLLSHDSAESLSTLPANCPTSEDSHFFKRHT